MTRTRTHSIPIGTARAERRRARRVRTLSFLLESLEGRELLASMPLGTGLVVPPGEVAIPNADANRLDTQLRNLYNNQATVNLAAIEANPAPLLYDSAGRVLVQATATDVETLRPSLETFGFVTVASMPDQHLIQGYLPISELANATTLGNQGLLGLVGINRPGTGVGAVTSQGDDVLEASRTRLSIPGLDGTGVTVGVLSDSYNNKGGAPADIASGDLPNNVNVLQDMTSGGSDEGRAMLQIVHDIAPGASLAYATAFNGDASFAQNIRNLAKPTNQGGAGAKVITDDVFYYNEPFWQPGIIAQAVTDVVANKGVSYSSLAGNLGRQSYESPSVAFGPDAGLAGLIGTTNSFYNFNAGGAMDPRMTFSIASGQAIILTTQWDQPYYTVNGVTTDIDVFLIDNLTGTVVAGSASNNLANQVPYETFGYQNPYGYARSYSLVINKFTGPTPGRIKFVNYGANNYGVVNFGIYSTNSPTTINHGNVPEAMSVGAVPFYDQKTAESYSSFGPATFLFAANGTSLGATVVQAKPDFLTTDGVSTTFFGSTVTGVPGYLFYGTSAAAPHAAGLAALMIQNDPSLTPAQISIKLKATADPVVAPGNLNQIGAGLANVYKAIKGAATTTTLNTGTDFGLGYLPQTWDVYNNGSGRVTVPTISGNRALVMDSNLPPTYYGTPGLSEAILHVNALGRQSVSLSFDARTFGSETLDAMPASFANHGNTDGVAISVNGGATWFRLSPLSGISTSFQTFTVDVSAIALANSLTLTADTLIKFQRYESTSGSAPSAKGIAYDNVAITALTSLTAAKIDDGSVQRSRIRDFTFDFAGNLTPSSLAGSPSAFVLKRSDGLVIPLTVGGGSTTGNGQTHLVLVPIGPNVVGGSIPDGRYTLTFDGSLLQDDAGHLVDAAGTGIAGSTRVMTFFRFFGDANGDGLVNANDMALYRLALIAGTVTPATSIFDADGNGVIDAVDTAVFLNNYRRRQLP